MNLTKQQKIGAVGGGVFGVAFLALGWMFYSAWSEKSEALTNLQTKQAEIGKLKGASKDAVRTVKASEEGFQSWRANATAYVAKGDRAFNGNETGSQLKQRLLNEVRRFQDLPGGVNGKISGPGFFFGFDTYLGDGGGMPSTNEIARLSAQLDTIKTVVKIFADAGVLEVKGIQRIDPPKAPEPTAADKRASKKGKKGAAVKTEEKPAMTKLSYSFTARMRPSALVTTLKSLAASPRFMVVRDFNFKPPASEDVITKRLSDVAGGQEQKQEVKSSSRRRGSAASALPVETNAKEVLIDVFNPEVDAELEVSFALDVYDFGQGKVVVETPVLEKEQEPVKTETKASTNEETASAKDVAKTPAKEETKTPAKEETKASEPKTAQPAKAQTQPKTAEKKEAGK